MWRALMSVLLPVLGISASDREDALEAVAPLAAALSRGDAAAFLRYIPPTSPNFAELQANVAALVAQAEVTSSVDVIKDTSGLKDLDWYMEIKSRATGTIIESRRGVVRIRHDGKRLRSIEPASHFAPPKVER